jgi:protein SERAC1
LTGHRDKTWTAAGEAEPWPKSLLSKDLPMARIITYGYDADVVHLASVAGQNTVREHAHTFINDLASQRTEAVGRPIIFVAHSLGGLICQDALLICQNPDEDAQADILSSTRGIAFLGTPHAGSDLERFATAMANIVSLVKKPNKRLLQVLNKDSETLANTIGGFHTMVQRRLREGRLKPIDLHAFIEEKPVEFLECVSSCYPFNWNNDTLTSNQRVVEPASAKIPGYGFTTIPANHMEMTKFHTASDTGYQRVLNRLKLWIGDDLLDDGTTLP